MSTHPVTYPMCNYSWGDEADPHVCGRPKGHGFEHECHCGEKGWKARPTPCPSPEAAAIVALLKGHPRTER